MIWTELHYPEGTIPIRSPHHRAFPWPAGTATKIPDAPCYVMARDPRPWSRVMIVVGCCGADDIARIRAGLEERGWVETRGIYGRPRMQPGWLYVTMAKESLGVRSWRDSAG